MTTKIAKLGDVNLAGVSRDRKEKYLTSLIEDDFRASVVIPIFKRSGLEFVRDTHGNHEAGKDCIFKNVDKLGLEGFYLVQTKVGHLNMSSKATSHISTAITQLRTALDSLLNVDSLHKRVSPAKVILCVSGKINEHARTHISDTLHDARIEYFDANDLIPRIDSLYPELWYGIDASKFPYLQKLISDLQAAHDIVPILDTETNSPAYCPISDETFVPLRLSRFTAKSVKRHGEYSQEPKIESILATSLLDQKPKLILITGEGGAGKTITLRRLAYKLASSALQSSEIQSIPVIIKAIDIASKDCEFLELVWRNARTESGGPSFTVQDLECGLIVLMIDGLDEVVLDRTKVISEIHSFQRSYPECRIIITSRDYRFIYDDHFLQSFAKYHVDPLGLDHAIKIVDNIIAGRRVTKQAARSAAKEMLRRLCDVHGITLTPFIVSVFAATSDFSKRDIPPNITEIFKKLTEMMLGRWDEIHSLSQQYEPVLKDFLLKQLAYSMHLDKVTEISRLECERILQSELKSRGHTANSADLLNELVYRCGLLREENDNVSFRNHLLQEYFAGRGIPSENMVGLNLDDEWWRMPIIFYYGERADRASELVAIARSDDHTQSPNLFNRSLTVGLALQACYLSKVTDKIEGLKIVIEGLAEVYKTEFIHDYRQQRYPLYAFLSYVLSGRDAVACDQLEAVANERMTDILKHAILTDEQNIYLFWILVGFLETDKAYRAIELIRRFKPQDKRLQLGLHLTAFHIANRRIVPTELKQSANRLCEILSPMIQGMIGQVKSEMKGLILEVAQGKIVSIESPTDASSGGTTIADAQG